MKPKRTFDLAAKLAELKKRSLERLQDNPPSSRSSSTSNDSDAKVFDSTTTLFGPLGCPEKLRGDIKQIDRALKFGFKPRLTDDGTSGTYLMRNQRKKIIGVFKPVDEEAFAPNNPRGNVGPFGNETFKPGVLSGEATVREVAAYLIDDQGFSGVPPTTMLQIQSNKLK